MVNKKSLTNGRGRMDLNPTKKTRKHRQPTRQPLQLPAPQLMRKTIKNHRMHAWVSRYDFKTVSGCGVAIKYTTHIVSNLFKQSHLGLLFARLKQFIYLRQNPTLNMQFIFFHVNTVIHFSHTAHKFIRTLFIQEININQRLI